VFVAGSAESPGLATAGVLRQTPVSKDGFVAKLNAAGSAKLWFTCFGGSRDDRITQLLAAVDYDVPFNDSVSPRSHRIRIPGELGNEATAFTVL
jgi:hypothetical protein